MLGGELKVVHRLRIVATVLVVALNLSGCANEAALRSSYTGPEGACISTSRHEFLNNPFNDIADAGILRIDGRDTHRAQDICVTPGKHSLDVDVMKGYGGAVLALSADFAPNAKYKLNATMIEKLATIKMLQISADGKELQVASADSRADFARPYVVPIIIPRSK